MVLLKNGNTKQCTPFSQGVSMKDVIFREYDIRGVVDHELHLDQVYDLTRAIAFYFHHKNPATKTIAVAMDGRIHSPAIKDEVCRALQDSGIDVFFVGTCPTPALYFSLFTKPVDGGIMITASHNGKEFNGMKICLGTNSIWGKEIQEIKNLYNQKKYCAAQSRGTITHHPIIPEYIAWLTNHFRHLRGMPLRMIIDCGNGAAGTVLPDLVAAMQWHNVTLLYPEVDGTYPHHEADPTIAANMRDIQTLLATTDAAVGIGLDGDCDRMVPMTKEGFLVPGDQLLSLFAQQILAQHPGAGIVFDIKSSSGLIELLHAWQAQPVMSPSGHSIIKDMMHKHTAILGGELSCHFFFKDRYFGYDDGIYAMLRMCEIVHASGKSLSELLKIFPRKCSSAELRLACPENKKQIIVHQLKQLFTSLPNAQVITIDGVRATFPFGWGLVRPSNTQASLSMRFESDTKDGLHTVMALFRNALTHHLEPSILAQFTQHMEIP
jgi:phosphomannomutase/phosphoglucomutase